MEVLIHLSKVRDFVLSAKKADSNCHDILVTDSMQRESAIAEDYWRTALKTGRKEAVDVSLQNIERQ